MAELCRLINGRTLDECLALRCMHYLNPRRRRVLGAAKPPCRATYAEVWRAVEWLARRGLIYCYRKREG